MHSSQHTQGLDVLLPVFDANHDAADADGALLLFESELLAAVFVTKKLAEVKEENRNNQPPLLQA